MRRGSASAHAGRVDLVSPTKAEIDREIDRVIQLPEWRQRSTNAIAQYLFKTAGWSRVPCVKNVWRMYYRVQQRRRTLGLIPKVVLPSYGSSARNGGAPMATGNIGRKNGVVLTDAQRELLADPEVLAKVDKFARWKANGILDFDDLMTVAYDALVVAARHWKPQRQNGAEKVNGQKWRAYAVVGVKRAINRAFQRKRAKLQRTVLDGSHPYQQWLLSERLTGNEDLLGKVAAPEDDGDSYLARYMDLGPRDKWLVEQLAGLDGKKKWSEGEIADFLGITLTQARTMIERAKAQMQG